MNEQRHREVLQKFGFLFGRGGPHAARTIMFEELHVLLNETKSPETLSCEQFRQVTVGQNILGKKSGKTRELTFRHLRALYGLDTTIPVFRVMVQFWHKEQEGHEMLAMLCALARDSLLRSSQRWILGKKPGEVVAREEIELLLTTEFPDRFSPVTLSAIAQRLNSSWTQTGHLRGKVKKLRQCPEPSVAATAYALYLGYLCGARGESLFHTDFSKVLDAPAADLMEKAEAAGRRGWIVVKRLGNIIEVLFPTLINEHERELLNRE